MDARRSIPLATALLLFCAGTASGQTPEARSARILDALLEEVQAQLRSGHPKTIAWGAHVAAEHRFAKSALRDALRALAERDNDPVHYAATTVLDALVQIGADVPVRELETFLGLGPAVVLLLRQERDTETLLRAFREQDLGFGAWRACGNALVTRNSPEFVAAVLRARIAPWVQVHDGEPSDLLPPSSIGCSFDWEHFGWPQFPRYYFSFGTQVGGEILTSSPFLTTWARMLRPDAGKYTSSSEFTLPEARASWLVHLIGKQHEPAVRSIDKDRALLWRGAASFAADVRALRAAIEADWAKVVAACVDAKVIPADVAKGLAPDIVLGAVNLLDSRTLRIAEPLPDVR